MVWAKLTKPNLDLKDLDPLQFQKSFEEAFAESPSLNVKGRG